MFERLKKMINKTKDKLETPKDVQKWQSKLDFARTQYEDQLKAMKTYEKYYKGDRNVQSDPNRGTDPTKLATNVRNIVYELIESQVDSSIPMPRIRAIHPEDDELAKKMEKFLENKVKTCGLVLMNDSVERTVPIVGGSFTRVEWDVKRGLHSEVGDLKITELHPKKIIPQPGVIDFDEMDYFFIQELMTKNTVKRVYGEDVSDCDNDVANDLTDGIEGASTNEDLVTVNTAFYRNEDGGVGIFVWCDYVKLLDLEEYEARYLDRCDKCGAVMVDGKCPECGSKKSKKTREDYEELVDAIEIKVNGEPRTVDPYDVSESPMVDEMGNPIMDEFGKPQMTIERTKKKIPYYKPNVYPVILIRWA